MPAARYWRAVGLQSVGGGALELSALHLYLGGVRVDVAATLASTFAPDSGQLLALQDADAGTTARWLDVSAPGFALVWDFGAGKAQDVRAVRLCAGALYDEWLESLTMQHSSDGVVWTTLGSIAAFTWPGAGVLQVVPADGDAYFLSTSLLIQPRAAGTAFADESPSRQIVTVAGQAAAVSDTTSPTGYSVKFDGAADWLEVPRSAALVFGGGDFTVECRFTANSAARDRVLVDFFQNGGGGWQVYLDSSGKPCFYEHNPNSTVLMGPSSVANGIPHDIAFSRAGTTLRLFVNGVLSGAVANSKSHIDLGVNLFIGAQVGSRNANYDFDGQLAYVRITKGVARYTDSFIPPSAPFTNGLLGEGSTVSLPPLLRTPAPDRSRIAASSPVPPHSALSVPPLLLARDMEFGGSGRIWGATKIETSPGSRVPTKARVSILRGRDKLLAREVWSDPVTGDWEAKGLDTRQDFVVLAQDSAGNYQPVAADKTLPEAP